MSNPIKYLESERIYLRRVEKEDIQHYLKAVSDPDIRFLTGTTSFQTRVKMESFLDHISQDNSRIDLVICLQENDEVIGDLAVVDIDQQNRNGSFRIAVTNKSYTSKGYGTEALKLVIHYMFYTLNLRRIAINVYAFNKRAIRTYEKLGFVQEGVLREELFYDGKYYDNILMGLLKREYKE